MGNAFIRKKDYQKAIEVLNNNKIPEGRNTINTGYLAFAFLRNGNIDKGKELIDSIIVEESLLSDYVRYEIYEELNNNEKAYSLLKNLYDKSDDDFKKHMYSKLSVALLDYHEKENELAKTIKTKIFLQVALVITVIILIFCIITFILLNKFQKQKVKIKNLNEAAKDLNNKINSSNENNTKLTRSVHSLLSTQFIGINEMCHTLYVAS